MTKQKCLELAKTLLGKQMKQLSSSQMTDVWRLQLAGYIFVWDNFIYETKGT